MATKKKKTPKRRTEARPAGSSAEVKLDPIFYPPKLVSRAAKDYAGLARIEARTQGDRLLVRFSGMRRGVADRLPDEFVNYLLSVVVQGT